VFLLYCCVLDLLCVSWVIVVLDTYCYLFLLFVLGTWRFARRFRVEVVYFYVHSISPLPIITEHLSSRITHARAPPLSRSIIIICVSPFPHTHTHTQQQKQTRCFPFYFLSFSSSSLRGVGGLHKMAHAHASISLSGVMYFKHHVWREDKHHVWMGRGH
jgi:hypothetical protein